MKYSTFGRHIVVDMWGIEYDMLDDHSFLQKIMEQAMNECGATILSVQSKKFSPSGVTILFLLSESHFSIHTYPEKGFAAVDCYTCGEEFHPDKAVNVLMELLKPQEVYTTKIVRGTGELNIEAL